MREGASGCEHGAGTASGVVVGARVAGPEGWERSPTGVRRYRQDLGADESRNHTPRGSSSARSAVLKKQQVRLHTVHVTVLPSLDAIVECTYM